MDYHANPSNAGFKIRLSLRHEALAPSKPSAGTVMTTLVFFWLLNATRSLQSNIIQNN